MGESDLLKRKKELIVVDDDKNSLETLSKLLSEDGYGVTACQNGIEALGNMKTKKFDAIITDLRMPEMGGIELLKNIRTIDPGLPVIIITAFGEVGSYLEAIVKGAYDYINKPIDYKELIRLLESLGRRE